MSPWGLNREEFSSGLRKARETAVKLDRDAWTAPYDRACLVPDFDVRRVLGRKGTRSMDRVTGLAVTALRHLLHEDGERLPGIGEDAGLVLGTHTGSAQSIMDFTRESLVSAKPFYVDPSLFPNTVMNCAAGQSAIWHQLKGPNTTIAGGRGTGLLALQYALRLQRAGRAETVLCGAVEEFSSARAWLDWHTRADSEEREKSLLGEGAAVWILESPEAARRHDRSGAAEVLGMEFGFAADSESARGVLADCVRALLNRNGVRAQEVWAVAPSQSAGTVGGAEIAALRDVLVGESAEFVSCSHLIGDTYAASSAFQVTALLALAEDGAADGRTALVTSVDRDGVVGAALLRTIGGRP